MKKKKIKELSVWIVILFWFILALYIPSAAARIATLNLDSASTLSGGIVLGALQMFLFIGLVATFAREADLK